MPMLRALLSPARGLLARAPRARVRHFRASTPARSGGATDWWEVILRSDQTREGLIAYHKLNFAMIALGPLALVLSPSVLNAPVDLLMGIMIPLHGHVGGNDVISDYAKKVTKAPWFDQALRKGLLGVTVITFFGLLKLNLQGPGITEACKSVWRPRVKSDA